MSLENEIERIVGSAGRSVSEGDDRLRERFRDRLLQRLGQSRYDLWFRGKATFRWDSETITVGVVNRHLAEWIEGQFRADIEAATRDTLGSALRVLVRVDPSLFAGSSAKVDGGEIAEPQPEAQKPKQELLFDIVDLPERFDPDGRDHLILSLSGRGPWIARAVSETLFRAWMHYGPDLSGGSKLCLGRRCQLCNDGRKRAYLGYFDSIRTADIGLYDRESCVRVVQGIPEGAAERIRLQGGLTRGRLYQFRKVSTTLTQVKVLRTECPYILSRPIEVWRPIARRYGFDKWPDQERETKEAP